MTTTELRGRTMFVIISRHAAAIEFIRQADHRFADAPVITGNASAADVAGKVVAGNLPLFLAAEAAEVVSVEFTGAPPRGQEYSLEDMLAAGARLAVYVVRRRRDADLSENDGIQVVDLRGGL